jgi:uncharacterized SAM-binding protein YcdF (DUF218 family)
LRGDLKVFSEQIIMFKFIKILIIFALLLALLFLGHGFILGKMGRYLYYRDEMKPADVIVVLAGEETERVEYGVKLFREGWARKDRIILAGGPLVWKYTWASLMKEQAISLGVSKKAILLEDKSRTTEEDAIFTKEILNKYGYKSCILVTSPYHSRRATEIFRNVMGNKITVVSAPSDKSWFSFDEWWKRGRDRRCVFSEYSKFMWLWIFGVKDNLAT